MPEGTISIVRFVLEDHEYGICTKQVMEVLRMMAITSLPTAPEFVTGVINRRGQTIVILDLRRRLGLGPAELSSDSRIIVAETDGRPIGIIVDAVRDVMSLSNQDIDAPSSYPISLDQDFVFGIVKTQDLPLILLNLEHIIMPQEKQDFADFSSVL